MRKWVLGFTILFLALLWFDILPQLRGGWGWQWPYAAPQNWSAIGVLFVLVLIYGIGTWQLRERINIKLGLLWAILGGFVLCLGIQNVRNDPFFMLFSHTVSPVQTGASTVATRFLAEEGVHHSLERWPDIMREANDLTITHFTTSPPGKALVHYWIAEATDPITPISKPTSRFLRAYQCTTLPVMEYSRGEIVSAGIGMLMPLWAAFAVLPIFAVAKQLGATKQLALRLAMWWPLVPSLLLFAPTWNTLYPLLALLTFSTLLRGLQFNMPIWIFLSGVLMSWMTFLNFAVLPVLGLLGFYTLAYWYFIERKTRHWTWPIAVGIYFGIGLTSIWFIFWLYSGNTPFDLLAVTFDQHLDIERNYWVWLVLHVYDMLMFAGWPLVALGVVGVWKVFQHWQRNASLNQVDILVLAWLATVVVLDISGITRAESARIWLFLVPFLLLMGINYLSEQSARWDYPLLVAQLMTVVVMGTVLPVVRFDMTPPVEGPRQDVPQIAHLPLIDVDARFDSEQYEGAFELEGYRYIADPSNQTITLELVWNGDVPTERPYQFELLAEAYNEQDGDVTSEPLRWYPQQGNYLSTCWQNEDVIHDVILLPLPPVSMPVEWTLSIQAIHPDDIMRVSGQDVVEKKVRLGPVPYP